MSAEESVASKDFMFHNVICTFIALRVLLCPLFCLGEGDVVSTVPHVTGCSCGAAELASLPCGQQPSDDRDRRNPSDEPCASGCVCQTLIEKPGKPFSIDPHDWPQFSLSSMDVGASLAPITVTQLAKDHLRPDLRSGMAIRLAFASLLL